MAERLIVRSYRRVFEVDRRIYRVDRWPVPVPGGVPLRGVVYFAVALVVVLALGALPGVSALVGVLTPPLRYVVLPLGVAVLGMQAAPDGRTAHRFAVDWLRLRVRARRRSAGRPLGPLGGVVRWDGVLATAWDRHSPRLRRGRVQGPARVRFSVAVAVSQRRRDTVVARSRPDGELGAALVIGAGQELEVVS